MGHYAELLLLLSPVVIAGALWPRVSTAIVVFALGVGMGLLGGSGWGWSLTSGGVFVLLALVGAGGRRLVSLWREPRQIVEIAEAGQEAQENPSARGAELSTTTNPVTWWRRWRPASLRLGGWARLWIVGALLMWIGGAWWLSENPIWRYSEPPECTINNATTWGEPDPADLAEFDRCLAEEGRRYLANREAIDAAAAQRERDYQLRYWTRIGAVALAPFLAGVVLWVVLLITRWVWRGFRPPQQRHEDVDNPAAASGAVREVPHEDATKLKISGWVMYLMATLGIVALAVVAVSVGVSTDMVRNALIGAFLAILSPLLWRRRRRRSEQIHNAAALLGIWSIAGAAIVTVAVVSFVVYNSLAPHANTNSLRLGSSLRAELETEIRTHPIAGPYAQKLQELFPTTYEEMLSGIMEMRSTGTRESATAWGQAFMAQFVASHVSDLRLADPNILATVLANQQTALQALSHANRTACAQAFAGEGVDPRLIVSLPDDVKASVSLASTAVLEAIADGQRARRGDEASSAPLPALDDAWWRRHIERMKARFSDGEAIDAWAEGRSSSLNSDQLCDIGLAYYDAASALPLEERAALAAERFN